MRLVFATLLAIGLHAATYGQVVEKKPEASGQERTTNYDDIFGPVYVPKKATVPQPRANPKEPSFSGNDLAEDAKGYDAAHSPGFGVDTANWREAYEKSDRFTRYVLGVLDGVYYAGWRWGRTDLPFETPGGVTHGQIYSVVSKYLREHPEQLHRWKEDLVIEAMAEAFPPKTK
jgi:hypothetical protein